MISRLSVYALSLLLAVAFADARTLRAQAAPLVLEVGGGAALPLGGLRSGHAAGEGTRAGPSFDLDFALSGSGRRTIFLGFSQHRFGCAPAGCAAGDHYVATGIDGGVRLNLLTRGSVLPWLGVGALTSRVEMPRMGNVPAAVSRLGLGADAGFGVFIGAARSIGLNPGVWFRAVNVGLPDGRGTLRMRYVVASVALVFSF